MPQVGSKVNVSSGGGSGSGITQLTGDVTAGPGSGSKAATLVATPAVEAIITANPAVAASATDQLTGDVTTAPGAGSQVATLAAVGAAGTYPVDDAHVPVITTDTKGRVTGIVSGLISIVSAQVSDLATTLSGYLAKTGGAMTGVIAMGANKITGLANGTASSDAAAFGQIPTALPPNGAAGGDLQGTYPSPTLVATGTPGTYGSASLIPIITTDANGRITGVTTAAPSASPTLSLTNYAPASAVYTLSTTAMTALDTTNLTTSSFVAPANGRVRVTVSGGILIGIAGARATFAMLNHSGGAQLGPTISAAFQTGTTALASCVCQTWTVTGLTPGNSYQLDLAGYSAASATSYNLAKTSTPLPADFGPCMILVESV